ncbi:MAG: DsrE family protein [Calditrichaeota bacterium]|nr:DsrE family protein [Calditrichota bacterium]
MKKIALFAFTGETGCFAHVLLNALDMKERGYEVRVVVEGTATKQVKLLAEEGRPFANLYRRAKEAGLIDCVCQACAAVSGSLEAALEQGLAACDEMSGHPSIARYLQAGFEVLIF